MAEVSARGVRFHVQRLGTPRPDARGVVFVHGLVMDNLSSWYFTVANALAQNAEVLLYDLRGHGRSSQPVDHYAVDDMVEDLAAVIDATLGGRPVILIGNSFGALVCLRFACAHPSRVHALALVDGHLGGVGFAEQMTATLALQGEARDRAIARSFQSWLGRHSARKRTRLAVKAQELIEKTTLVADLRSSLPILPQDLTALRVPTLALYGENSDLRRPSEELLTAMPNSRVVILSGCTHSILWEATAEVRQMIVAFVGDQQKSSSL